MIDELGEINKCLRCGHNWRQRALMPPRACPNCRSYAWNRPYTTPLSRNAVHIRVHRAIKNGMLIRPEACEECGKKQPKNYKSEKGFIHAHHKDHTKPFDITWLCPDCHIKQHKPWNTRWNKPQKEAL